MTWKQTRAVLASVTLCAAVVLTAYNGSLDWMGMIVFAGLFGLPEARKVGKWMFGWFRKDEGNDRCNSRKD